MDELEAILYLERGPQPNLRFPLHQLQTTIGRNAGNDLVIVDPEVSRRHAHILRHEGQFIVEDLGSTNGTFVNGARVSTQTSLQDGDVIELADTVRLRFIVTRGHITGPKGGEAAIDQPRPQPAPSLPPKPASPPAMTPPSSGGSGVAYSAGDAAGFAGQSAVPLPDQPGRGGRRWLLGCVAIVALALLCIGTFIVLDAYDQGRLLYCGPLRPLFEFFLGPLGFAPLC